MGKLDFNILKKDSIKIIEPDFSYIDGDYLRKFRMNMKFSQALLADYLGVSKKAIEKWEQGKNKMNPVVARMIYLMERDSSVYSLLKEIIIDESVFEIKPISIFGVSEIQNNTSIADIDAPYEIDLSFDNDWKINKNNKTGGLKNATSTI